jgi:hypothetical protein
MRAKRFLLVTAALSTAASATVACGKKPATPEVVDAGETLPLPANPKGSFYDADIEPPPLLEPADAEAPKEAGVTKPPPRHEVGEGSVRAPHPLPANPKGSHYDAGRKKPTDPGF